MNLLKISVGIPTYNEEHNIRKLIRNLLSQKEKNYLLKEIIVYSDGSSDNTKKQVLKVKDSRIKLFVNSKRKGKTYCQNKILNCFSGDAIVLLDSDVLLGKEFLYYISQPLIHDQEIGIVSCQVIPCKPRNYFESVISYSDSFKTSIYHEFRNCDNIYLCYGRARALSRKFAKEIIWPDTYSEDVYSYIYCRLKGYKFYYQKSTQVYFRLPDNFSDHYNQSLRFLKGRNKMTQYFKKEIVEENYKIPLSLILNKTISYFFRNPLFFLSYVLILMSTITLSFKENRVNTRWVISISSKKVT